VEDCYQSYKQRTRHRNGEPFKDPAFLNAVLEPSNPGLYNTSIIYTLAQLGF